MKIAFIGQKGVPAHFGGIEFHVDELSRRLVRRGHRVSTYVRSWYTPRDLLTYDGVRLVHTPTIRTKHLDAALHSLMSSLHALGQKYDIVHYHALGPSFFAWIPRLRGQRVIVTIHGLDWQRPKWGRVARAFLKLTERTAVHLADRTIVVSESLKEYFESKYGQSVYYIPNGVTIPSSAPPPHLITERWGFKGQDYILFLGRLVPEKRVDWLIQTFRQTSSRLPLVIAGDDDGMNGYGQYLRRLSEGDNRLLFTGVVGGQTKAELLSNAFLFIAPSMVEGLPIALLEAMAYGRCCLVSNIPAHREIIETNCDGMLFEQDNADQFKKILEDLLIESGGFRQSLGEGAKHKVSHRYNWADVVDATESLYYTLLRDSSRGDCGLF